MRRRASYIKPARQRTAFDSAVRERVTHVAHALRTAVAATLPPASRS